MPQDPFGLLRGQRADDIGYFKASGEWVPLHRPTASSILTHTGSEGGLAWKAVTAATGIDHGGLAGLSDDDHTQYALLAGRNAANQLLIGSTQSGGDLALQSTSHATRGNIFFGSAGNSYYDEANDLWRFSGDLTMDSDILAYMAGQNRFRFKNSMVRATGTSTQSISTGVVTAITWDTEGFDTDGLHSTSSNTSRLTAAIAGKYQVTGGVLWSASAVDSATLLLLRISKNGSVISGTRSYFPPISSIATNGQGQSTGCLIDLAASDYVELEVFHDSTGSRNIDRTGSSFQMVYVGE